MFRHIRAIYWTIWRRGHPMCSRCGTRMFSGPNHPAECMCPYLPRESEYPTITYVLKRCKP